LQEPETFYQTKGEVHIMAKNFRKNHHRTIVINATNIGRALNGIGVYTLSLLKALSTMETGLNFIVYLNKNCEPHLREITFPDNFRANILRLLYANYLSIKHRKLLIFTTSQAEACLFRSNQVITIHDVIPLLFREFHKKQYYFFRYVLKYALRAVKCVITPSRHSQGLIKEIYRIPAGKIQVIPNGIQAGYKIAPGYCMLEKDQFILYTGRISPMKNIAGIFKAFARIKDKIPHKLVIVGEEKSEIEKEIHAGRLSKEEVENKRIIFKGHIPDGELQALMKQASLLIFPSLYEGFGLPPLEAMACGCPVVVSNAASLPEVCGSAAYYVDPYRIESITEGMYRVLTNRRLRKYLIHKGFTRAKLYSWEASASGHLGAIYQALNISPVYYPQPTQQLIPVTEMQLHWQ